MDDDSKTRAKQRLGEYDLLEAVKKSPSGSVYRAQNSLTGRTVLVKTMPEAAKDHLDVLKRFQREIRLASQLSHPNLITAHHAGVDRGVHYLVLENVEGQDLAKLVKQEGPLSAETAIDYICQAGRGLGYLHAQGVFHRNVKPANLLLDEYGVVHVTNMTSALVDEGADLEMGDQEQLTRQGQILGTTDYMAPEQAFDAHSVDARSDIYSLGCSLHFLLTGKPPFPAKDPKKRAAAHAQAEIPSLAEGRSDVSEKLDGIFQKMLAKVPTDRYASMDEVINELQEARYGGGGNLSERRWAMPWELVVVVLFAGLLFGVLGSVLFSF